MDRLKYLLALVGGAMAAYFQKYALLYALVATAVALDLITGMCAAVIEGTGLSSSIARKGFLKKMVSLVSVAFGTFLDVLMPFASEKVGLEIGGTLIFSSVICVYICITECISIAENICRCSGSQLPGWIIKLLKQAKERTDNDDQN